MKKFLTNVCLVVGGTVGVGFLSGKELLIFVGTPTNIVVFVVMFAAAQIAYSLWAVICRSADIQSLCDKTFGRLASVVYLLLLLGNVATVVALLATADESLCEITGVNFVLPIFALCVCILSCVIGKSEKTVKMFSAFAVVCAVAYTALPLFCRQANVAFETENVHPIQTAIYASFSSTALCGVTIRIAHSQTVKQNIVQSVAASTVLGGLMLLRMSCPATQTSSNVFVTLFCAVTYLTSATTSVYAGCVAPLSLLNEITHDRTLSAYALFALCLSLCLLQADFLIKLGYTLVGTIGTLLVSVSLGNFCALAKAQKTK